MELKERVEIVRFVERESWFEYDGDIKKINDDNDYIPFVTRKHGSVYNEEVGEEDWEEAKRMKKVIKEKYGFDSELSTFDEWVSFYIQLN